MLLIRHFCGANIHSLEARYSDVRNRMYGKDKKGSAGVLKDIIYNL